MHGPSIISLCLVTALLGAGPAPTPREVTDARRALAEKHPAVAINLLEQALGDPGLTAGDKTAVLGFLRQAYEQAADQAEAAGRPVDAESLRENARILKRKSWAAPAIVAAAASRGPEPIAPAAPESPAPTPRAEAPSLAAEPASAPLALPDVAVSAEPTPEPLGVRPGLRPPGGIALAGSRSTNPPAVVPTPTRDPVAEPPSAPPPGPGLDEADAAFRAGSDPGSKPVAQAAKFAEAGRIYGRLAEAGQLPPERYEHWAYCRSSEVARRIAQGPKSEGDWAKIDAEIAQIRALAPDNWLGEYLRNRALDRPTARKAPKNGSTVVRAASPEEPPAPRPARTKAAAPAPAPAPSRGPAEVADRPAAQPEPGVAAATPEAAGPIGRWQIRESTNFRVFHADPNLAERVIQVAEAIRREQVKRWSGSAASAPWQPRCEIYLYPKAQHYAQMTGQPPDSPGFSTMGMNEGQIISRRVNLRADHAGLLAAVLPHEVTHVILADYFTEQQIPRWADEGMAVLTEPVAEQKRRAADLVEPLNRNLLFPIDTLMTMDYPDNRYWSLYYAQSVSLTRFLVEQGTPAQLVQFLQGAQTKGFEAELRRVYKIDGYPDLQARWVVYARAHLDGAPASTATAANPPRAEGRTR